MLCVHVCIYMLVCVVRTTLYSCFFSLLYVGARVELMLGLPRGCLYLLSHLLPQLCGFKR